MSSTPHTGDDVVESLTAPRRRYALAVLSRWPSPVSVSDLATHIAAWECDKQLLEVTEAEHRHVLLDLYHAHLPKFEDAGLIEYEPTGDAVTLVDQAALHHPLVADAIDSLADSRARPMEDVLPSLANSQRRTILSVLADANGPITIATLADRILARESGRAADEDRYEVQIGLYHAHLPKLAEAGVVDFDADRGEVAYVGHPALRREWFASTPADGVAPDESRSATEIRMIEGREGVLAHGQALCERAEDEIFLMLTTDGLLEDACLVAIQHAIDRGADVYVGSRTEAVRDLVREQLPDAVIWEPQLDWLNLPPTQEKVGRLLLVDREAIMLGTIGEQNADGVYAETAIAGDGENNPLVVLMRELLGSRIDHLDFQSEDVLSHLPL